MRRIAARLNADLPVLGSIRSWLNSRRGIGVTVVSYILLMSLPLGCSVLDKKVAYRYEAFRDAGPPASPRPPVAPVIFVPGIKGSVLSKGGTVIWGTTRVGLLWKFDDLLVPLPLRDGADSGRFVQGVTAPKILEDFVVLSAPIQLPIYRGLREILEEGGGFIPDKNIFYFPYDWRLDNRVAAVALAHRLADYRKRYYEYVKEAYCARLTPPRSWPECLSLLKEKQSHLFAGNDIKFNLVAHSMGGLVARYFVRGLGYGADVHRLVLIATPNQGAMDTVAALIHGEYPLGEGLLRNYFYSKDRTRPVILSFPSTFQLLPRYGGIRPGADSLSSSDLALAREKPSSFATAAGHWLNVLDSKDAGWRSALCERSGPERDPSRCAERVRRHVEDELMSSYYLHATLKEGLSQNVRGYERTKVERVEGILGVPAGSTIRGQHDYPDRIYQFAGHCDDTLTYGQIGPKWIQVCDGLPASGSRCVDFGDGRVPRRSVHDEGLPQNRTSTFVLCRGHVEIVESAALQDNLLRILLEDRLSE
jgi:Lecithin:cholesterol acyltransferase